MKNEFTMDVDGIQLSALRSNNGIRHRILCIHGWLDNANSFLPLLPLIHDAEIVAIDLPGHGYSDHLEHYSIASQAHIVLRTANALGWQNFSLIGHSLGGCIAPFAAATAPDRIDALVLLEALGPRAESASALPDRLKKYHHDLCLPEKYTSRRYNAIEDAIDTRLRANQMQHHSAQLIIERQLIKDDQSDQWLWRFDSKLRHASPHYFTEDQVQAVLSSINCSTLLALAEQGYLVARPETQARLKKLQQHTLVTLPGFHHFHMDTPQPVADAINQFMATKEM